MSTSSSRGHGILKIVGSSDSLWLDSAIGDMLGVRKKPNPAVRLRTELESIHATTPSEKPFTDSLIISSPRDVRDQTVAHGTQNLAWEFVNKLAHLVREKEDKIRMLEVDLQQALMENSSLRRQTEKKKDRSSKRRHKVAGQLAPTEAVQEPQVPPQHPSSESELISKSHQAT